MRKIAAIWAEDKNGLIGDKGKLPWHLPKEQAYFKKVTIGSDILMGRKTFDGFDGRLLPHRQNLVLSHAESLPNLKTILVHSRKEALQVSQKDLYVIGGREIFKLFMEDFEELYQTRVEGEFEGDTYMTPIDYSNFELLDEEVVPADEKNLYAFTLRHWRRKNV